MQTSSKENILQTYINFFIDNSDIFFDRIASIKILEPQHVYDLSIEGTRNFIANDIVAHNTYLATSSGKVGIGKTNPATELDVAGGINSSTLNVSGNVFLATQSGNVGIGTTGPGYKLVVTSADGVVSRFNSSYAGFVGFELDASDGTNGKPYYDWRRGGAQKAYAYVDTNNYWKLSVNDGDRVTVDTNGNVGIGATNPAHKLTVAGSVNITGNISLGNSLYLAENQSLYQPVYGSDDDLVLYLPFNAPNGSTQYDRSPFGNDGRISGNVNCNATNGKYGAACSFSGVADFINISKGDFFAGLNKSSLSLWFYWVDNDASGDFNVFSQFNPNTGVPQLFVRAPNSLIWGRSGGGDDITYTSATDITPNKWVFATVTYDGTNTIMYVNGNRVGSVSQIATPGGGYSLIGVRDTSTTPFNGTIDEVMIYKRALAPEEIRTHYLRGNGFGASGAITADKFRVVNTTGARILEINQTGASIAPGGVQRLTIDSSGNVGINQTSPSSRLQVAGTANITAKSTTSFLMTAEGNVVFHLE